MEKPGYSPPEAKQFLYNERISSQATLDRKLDDIQEAFLLGGEIKLSDPEKSGLFEFEAQIAKALLPISKIKVRESLFYVDFFKTDDGKEAFKATTGVDLPQDDALILGALFANKEALASVASEERQELTAKSQAYNRKVIMDRLEAALDDEGNLGDLDSALGEKINVILDDENLAQKSEELRVLKKSLTEKWQALKDSNSPEALAQQAVIEIYLQRINDFLIDIDQSKWKLAQKALALGVDSLTPAEQKVLGPNLASLKRNAGTAWSGNSILESPNQSESEAARLDKLEYGAENEYTDRSHHQVGSELKKYADDLLETWTNSAVGRRSDLASRDIDADKVDALAITPAQQHEIAEEHLRSIGMLSTEEYDPDHPEPPADGLYRVYTESGRTSASVEFKDKVLFLPDKKKSFVNVTVSQNGHEINGHIYQDINAQNLPLKIFEEIGVGRRTPFTEGGAVARQDEVEQELFGRIGAEMPHYILALEAKMSGANYLECVKVYHQARVRPYQIQLERGEISEEEFKKNVAKSLRTARGNVQRIFARSSLNSRTGHLTNTKDTVYAEQALLAKRLKERGMEDLLMIRGVNLDVLYRLAKFGLYDIKSVKMPTLDFVKELWHKERSKYTISSNEPSGEETQPASE